MLSENKPTLSILMSNYNHAKYIGEALEAIISQSYKPIEIVVIDDASTDNSVEIIQKIVDQTPVMRLHVNVKNMGVIYNGNSFLQMARGDYVYWAAADDKVLPGFLEKSMDMLKEYPQAGVCSTPSYLINEEGTFRGLLRSAGIISTQKSFISPEKAQKVLMKYGSWILGNSAIYRKNALLESGGFIPELRSFADGFIQQVLALKYGACYIPEPLTCWRRMETGYHESSSKDEKVQMEIISRATELMETTYQGIFPKGYVDWWRKKQMFLLNWSLWSSADRNRHKTLTYLRKPDNYGDKLFLGLVKAFSTVELFFAAFYFLLLYRFFPGKIIRRNIVSYVRQKKLGI